MLSRSICQFLMGFFLFNDGLFVYISDKQAQSESPRDSRPLQRSKCQQTNQEWPHRASLKRNCTLHSLFYQIYFGDGSAKSSKRIRQHYFGINKIQVLAFLNSHPIHSKSNPTFKNKAPLQPIVSQQIMERHQVDLVSFEKKMWLNLITNVIRKF